LEVPGESDPGLPVGQTRRERQTPRDIRGTLLAMPRTRAHKNVPAIVWPQRLVHGICHYHRQWILGDERGFRSRDHRIHSSGDYKNPPPPAEHEGLRRWVQSNMKGGAVTLTVEQRAAVGAAFVKKLQRMRCAVFILGCGPTHLHVLFEATEDDMKRQLGKAKQFASLKCPNHSGQLWGESCEAIAVNDDEHAVEVFGYIDDHRDEGAWIWRCDRD